jgi:hypothetical protein
MPSKSRLTLRVAFLDKEEIPAATKTGWRKAVPDLYQVESGNFQKNVVIAQ